MLIRMHLFKSFKPFNRFAPFKPPLFSSPATAGGEKEGRSPVLNDLNILNVLNMFFLMSRPLRWRPIKIPIRPAEIGSNDGEHDKAADETGEERQRAGSG